MKTCLNQKRRVLARMKIWSSPKIQKKLGKENVRKEKPRKQD